MVATLAKPAPPAAEPTSWWHDRSATVDRVQAKADDIDLRAAALTLLALFLWGVGWVIRKVFAVAAAGIRWVAAAFMVGWAEAGAPSRAGARKPPRA